MPRLFDTHCHVNFKAFKTDSDAVIRRALDEGTWLTNVGAQLSTSQRAVAMAEKYPQGVYAAVGLHPVHVAPTEVKEELAGERVEFVTHGETFDPAAYEALARREKTVAIGEIGLDFAVPGRSLGRRTAAAGHVPASAWAKVVALQAKVFEAQLELADKVKKPVIIHCRNAHEDVLKILEKRYLRRAQGNSTGKAHGIAHFFTGTLAQAERYWQLGFYIAFGGVITFAKEYWPLVTAIPLERLVIETDAPYVTPAPFRGQRNEPSYVKFTAQKISELKGVSEEEVAQVTTQNALTVFNIKA